MTLGSTNPRPPPPPPPPRDLCATSMAILVILLPHLAGAAIPLATTQSLRIPTFPPPYLLRAITC